MVVDSKSVFIGTFNLDPRSENLNTEVGVIIHNETLAHDLEAAIETDMTPITVGTRPPTIPIGMWPAAR